MKNISRTIPDDYLFVQQGNENQFVCEYVVAVNTRFRFEKL